MDPKEMQRRIVRRRATNDAGFSEGDHPRDDDGQFTATESEVTARGRKMRRFDYKVRGESVGKGYLHGEEAFLVQTLPAHQRKGYAKKIVEHMQSLGANHAQAVTPESEALFKKLGWTQGENGFVYAPKKAT